MGGGAQRVGNWVGISASTGVACTGLRRRHWSTDVREEDVDWRLSADGRVSCCGWIGGAVELEVVAGACQGARARPRQPQAPGDGGTIEAGNGAGGDATDHTAICRVDGRRLWWVGGRRLWWVGGSWLCVVRGIGGGSSWGEIDWSADAAEDYEQTPEKTRTDNREDSNDNRKDSNDNRKDSNDNREDSLG